MQPMFQAFDAPRLIAEIDGEFARFGLELAKGQFGHKVTLRCADQADFEQAVTVYLRSLGALRPRHAAIAIAYPVDGDWVRMTNFTWQFSIEAVRQALGLETLVVVNDFTALAMAVPGLSGSQRRQIGQGAPRVGSVIGVIGAGAGLGVSGIIPASEGWVALGTEGGHASFAPRDARELRILQFAWTRHSHVSCERLISNSGLELMYEALSQGTSSAGLRLSSREIVRQAMDASCSVCVDVLDVFCALLGTAAGNLAVTLGAKGGIYVGGSIAPQLGSRFDQSRFRERFEDKGRFSEYLRSIPTYVITASEASFDGAAAILDSQLREMSTSSGAVLQRIQQGLANLSPAERRVAEHVLSHPRQVMGDPIAAIANAAHVSQPTVIRFCRSLGCDGLSDFKLKLAASLSATLPITHVQVRAGDKVSALGAKVMGNTAAAVLSERDRLDWMSVENAVQLLLTARRVDVYAVGHAASVAVDAQFKFLRVGLPSAAYVDQRLQLLAADSATPGDLLLIISASGQVSHLVEACQRARERGASVVAITSDASPLAEASNVAICLDQTENLNTHASMLSRFMQLLVIDVLAVSIAAQRRGQVLDRGANVESGRLANTEKPATESVELSDNGGIEMGAGHGLAPATRGPALGISRAGGLASMTSHGLQSTAND